MKNIFGSFALLATFAACGHIPQHPSERNMPALNTEFADSVQYAPFLAGGTGVLSGKAFMKTQDGEVKLATGNTVYLDPATSYSSSWWTSSAFDMKMLGLALADPLFQKTRRRTTADDQGRFKFTGLAPGSYYVHTAVTWGAGGPGPVQGSVVGMQTLVVADSTRDVVLTR